MDRNSAADIGVDCYEFDTQAPRANSLFRQVAQQIAHQYAGRPIIAYGSRISGEADSYSDFDFLVLEYDRNFRPKFETLVIGEQRVDLTRVGRNFVARSIRTPNRTNDRWFLNALRNCRIYADVTGEAWHLKDLADQIFTAGPPEVSRRRLETDYDELVRLYESAEKLCARASNGPDAAKVARMRCDQLVTRCIYLFFILRREWTTSLPRLLERCRKDHPDFYALWVQYARAEGPQAALTAAVRMMETAYHGIQILDPANNRPLQAQSFPVEG